MARKSLPKVAKWTFVLGLGIGYVLGRSLRRPQPIGDERLTSVLQRSEDYIADLRRKFADDGEA